MAMKIRIKEAKDQITALLITIRDIIPEDYSAFIMSDLPSVLPIRFFHRVFRYSLVQDPALA